MQQFELVLKNEKEATYTIISGLILLLNFFAFLIIAFAGYSEKIVIPLSVALVLSIALTLLFLNKRKNKSLNNLFSFSFKIIVIGWVAVSFYWLAGISLFILIIREITSRKPVVKIFEDKIDYPSFPQKTFLWQQLNNVILKDGILTIDCRNNKVFQNEIISELNEQGFNEFCNQRLKATTSI